MHSVENHPPISSLSHLSIENEEEFLVCHVESGQAGLLRMLLSPQLPRVEGLLQTGAVTHVLAHCLVTVHLSGQEGARTEGQQSRKVGASLKDG